MHAVQGSLLYEIMVQGTDCYLVLRLLVRNHTVLHLMEVVFESQSHLKRLEHVRFKVSRTCYDCFEEKH